LAGLSTSKIAKRFHLARGDPGAARTIPGVDRAEWRLEIKTTADRVTALTAHIKDNHSYDLPEIIAIPITGGSAEYLSWLIAETCG